MTNEQKIKEEIINECKRTTKACGKDWDKLSEEEKKELVKIIVDFKRFERKMYNEFFRP